jgi:hypothetical protein
MNKEQLFAQAKREIFGAKPKDPEALIGYNWAVTQFESIIEEAEGVYLGIRMPKTGLSTYIRNAFSVTSEPTLKMFPQKTQEVMFRCCEKFRERYEELLDKLEPKAA